ncbi:MAG TPA: damage-inducible protein CinA [Desulfotomaculum sp.]|nr:damage-inducible protein CinA [Desulfotomaculum sp.]
MNNCVVILGEKLVLFNEQKKEAVARLLTVKKITLAVAESCTGGLIAVLLTDVAGSSQYFLGGIVAYANLVKEKILGVSAEILQTYGAVSEQTAIAMAYGVKNLLEANVGLSVTGIAGPAGGSLSKPVGLVYIALVTPKVNYCQEFRFTGKRFEVRQNAAAAGLDMLHTYLSEHN